MQLWNVENVQVLNRVLSHFMHLHASWSTLIVDSAHSYHYLIYDVREGFRPKVLLLKVIASL